jgi:hypothetical protein
LPLHLDTADGNEGCAYNPDEARQATGRGVGYMNGWGIGDRWQIKLGAGRERGGGGGGCCRQEHSTAVHGVVVEDELHARRTLQLRGVLGGVAGEQRVGVAG